ncbi:hypothetical protein L202_07048 [Cryptococcus amylolentus CBS 6039]|uniref:Uncharacterized protein n=1 Tax=Cryptococcus amylolentus CBS 6039 TaxID=1295533 RepID=A0A1E3HEF7_9TREE|nr:hypothetical protein L202_07048 [Cryptococcus amylolentus CBS 6039]ODN74719.1 hypothetical protein L202_07048 [Cryptococcus amylolentus CBS 6039]
MLVLVSLLPKSPVPKGSSRVRLGNGETPRTIPGTPWPDHGRRFCHLLIAFSHRTAPRATADNCSCGYILSSHSNAYFPKSHTVSFSSISSVSDSGFGITNGWKVGSLGPDGTRAVGTFG